ncbi:hypothetical protein C0J52_26246 [Blattella germanica]|nr:hypothetical protein C0J52_26246 [Blattella germanica]
MYSKEELRDWIKKECAKSPKHGLAKQLHQKMQKKFGAAALPYTTVAWWVKEFEGGRESVADKPGRHQAASDKDVAALLELVQANPKLTLHKMAQSTGLAVQNAESWQ